MKYVSTTAALLLVAVLALFGASAAPAPVAAQSSLNPPRNIIAANGDNPGEVIVSWDAAPEANVYRVGWIVFADYEAAINDGRNWLEAFVFVDVDNRGQSSHTVTRLQPGVQYYFIVGSAAMRFGSAKWPPAWSPPVVVRTPPPREPWFPRPPTATTECYVGQRLTPGQSCLVISHTFHRTFREVFAVADGGPYHGWGQIWDEHRFTFDAHQIVLEIPMAAGDFTFAARKRDSVFVVEQYGPDPMTPADSCAPSADLTFDNRPPQGGTLVRLFADPPTLDPHLAGDVTSSVISNEVFGGLVTLSLHYQPVLDLAESCSVSADGLVYTFILRENATFHDGKPVTAHDVKWSIERAADPATASHTAETYLGDIVGVTDKLCTLDQAAEGKCTKANAVRGVRVIDDRTVEIEIDAPKSYFLAKLTYPTAYVLDQDQVTEDSSWLEQPNGTGPFKLGAYEVGELIVLERNENYHLGPPHLESIQMILSGGSAMIMYENDEIHLTEVDLDDLPQLLEPSDPLYPQLHRSPPDFEVFYIGLNVAEPPFDDPKVRQALNYAIDLQSIADNVLDGRLSPARGVIPPGFPSYRPNLRSYEFNPDLARELIQSSTYGDALAAGEFPRITLTISGSFGAAIPTYLEVILEQWKQELGIEVDIQQTEWATFLADVNDKKYQMFSLGWIADYLDPENFLDLLFHSDSTNNHTSYDNPEVDRLLQEARTERDRDRRSQIYNQVEQMILDDAPWVWTWFSGEGYTLIKPEVSDYFLLQMNIPKYRYIYFK